MNVLITGVAGLLGSRLADWIINNKPEYNVFGIDDLSGGYIENINSKVKFYKIDLVHNSVSDIFEKHRFNYVFHFAAYAAEGLSPFIRSYNYDNNLKSTVKIINECINSDVERFVFTSSMAVYGHGKNKLFDETQIPNPIDPYGVAKYACEMDIKIAGEQHGLDWCIIRPHNVYGINQNIWDKYRNVLGIWMYQLLNNQDITIYGDGLQTRAFSYMDDGRITRTDGTVLTKDVGGWTTFWRMLGFYPYSVSLQNEAIRAGRQQQAYVKSLKSHYIQAYTKARLDNDKADKIIIDSRQHWFKD